MAGSEDSLRSTFLLSNTVPQSGGMNSGIWRTLENHIRRLAASADALIVLTGPIFEGEIGSIGAGHVAVPTHLFKLVLVLQGSHKSMFAAIVPNSPATPAPLDHYRVPSRKWNAAQGSPSSRPWLILNNESSPPPATTSPAARNAECALAG